MKIYLLALNRQPFNHLCLPQDWQTKLDTENQIYFKIFRDIIICITYRPIGFSPQELLNYLNVEQADIIVICRHTSQLFQQNNNWLTNRIIDLAQTPIGNFNLVNQLVRKSVNGEINWTNNLDPLIVIFTNTDHDEWWKAIKVNNATFNDDNCQLINNSDKEKIRIAEFKVDNNYTVLFVKENDYGADKGGINNLLSQILDQWGKIFSKENIYVAVHALSDYAKDENVDGFKDEFKDKVNYICDFHHVKTDPDRGFCELLIKFLEEVENGSIEIKDTCEKIIGKIKELTIRVIQNFSLLKHRIAHLFLPLDIDLQGISEVENAKKIEYLKEVLNEKKSNHYYRQKLADLWYIITGRNNFEGKVNDCEIIKPQHDLKDLLKENKAIIGIINESGKQDKVKNLWEILLNLCGIKYAQDSSQYSVINSPIFSFMCLMDKKIEKNMIEKHDVEDILNYFSKLNGNKGWEINEANPEIIKSFHDWFCALMDCLDKIREKLKDEQGK